MKSRVTLVKVAVLKDINYNATRAHEYNEYKNEIL